MIHALIDLAFFTAMVWLCNRRLDELEAWSDDAEERLSSLEAREQADSYEVNYLMEQAEKAGGG